MPGHAGCWAIDLDFWKRKFQGCSLRGLALCVAGEAASRLILILAMIRQDDDLLGDCQVDYRPGLRNVFSKHKSPSEDFILHNVKEKLDAKPTGETLSSDQAKV